LGEGIGRKGIKRERKTTGLVMEKRGRNGERTQSVDSQERVLASRSPGTDLYQEHWEIAD